MECFPVKNHSKSQNRIRILISGNRLNSDRYLERSRHAHGGYVRLWSNNFQFLYCVARQAIYVNTIVFACDDRESLSLSQLLRTRREIGGHSLEVRIQNTGVRMAGATWANLFSIPWSL